MPDPTGRWISQRQWQCPACGAVNSPADERCRECDRCVRPSDDEPIRPVDPLDLIGKGGDREKA